MTVSQLLEAMEPEELDFYISQVHRLGLPHERVQKLLLQGNIFTGGAVGVKYRDIIKSHRWEK